MTIRGIGRRIGVPGSAAIAARRPCRALEKAFEEVVKMAHKPPKANYQWGASKRLSGRSRNDGRASPESIYCWIANGSKRSLQRRIK